MCAERLPSDSTTCIKIILQANRHVEPRTSLSWDVASNTPGATLPPALHCFAELLDFAERLDPMPEGKYIRVQCKVFSSPV